MLPAKKDLFDKFKSKNNFIRLFTNCGGNVARGDFFSTLNGDLGTQLQVVVWEFDIIGIATTGMVKKAVDRVEGDTSNASFIAMWF